MKVSLPNCRLMLRNSVRNGNSAMDNEATNQILRSSARIGRKGDPRMHRAVGARIANPELSLFDALQIGGFGYDNDDDPNSMDSEQVTLGQRKNQLCRRIRMALRQCNDKNLFSDTSCCSANKSCTYKSFSLEDRGSIVTGKISVAQRQSKQDRKSDIPELSNHFIGTGPNSNWCVPSDVVNSDATDTQHEVAGPTLPTCFELGRKSITSIPDIIGTDTSAHLATESLKQTATSLGMTLDQFALFVANWNDPMNDPVCALNSRSLSRHDCAVALYQNQSRLLLHKAMLFAGYSPHDMHNDDSPVQLQVALSVWKREGQMIRESIVKLRGKGKMPILHQPTGCAPHFDFLVDNRVECCFDAESNQRHKADIGRDQSGIPTDCFFGGDTTVNNTKEINLDDNEWNLVADCDINEVLLSFLSSNDSFQIQSIHTTGEKNDNTTYRSIDDDAVDPQCLGCHEAV